MRVTNSEVRHILPLLFHHKILSHVVPMLETSFRHSHTTGFHQTSCRRWEDILYVVSTLGGHSSLEDPPEDADINVLATEGAASGRPGSEGDTASVSPVASRSGLQRRSSVDASLVDDPRPGDSG